LARTVLWLDSTFWEEGSMPQILTQSGVSNREVSPSSSLPSRERALKILSKSIYKDLRHNGYEPRQILALASEIISFVTSEIKDESPLD
jgi:hypothetical protein